MKLSFLLTEKATQKFAIVEGKNMEDAFNVAVKKYGINGFSDFKRYIPGEGLKKHKMSILKRAISNVSKHLHKENRKGF